MSFHTFFFNAIDKIYYRRQNCRRETRFEDDHCFSLMWRGASARRCNALLADFLRRFAAGGKLCGMRKLQ